MNEKIERGGEIVGRFFSLLFIFALALLYTL